MTDKILKLSRPLKFGDKVLNDLTIREPTAGQLMDHGVPFTPQGPDWKAAGGLLEACTGVHLPVLKNMRGSDLIVAVELLAELCQKEEGAIDEGNSPAS